MTEIRCGGCPATWTAPGAAHCAACHRTFSGVSLFDLHRSQYGERGSCQDPGDVRHMMFLRDGMWRGPEMTEEGRKILRGSA
jgi:hypothetical protein